ncbi:MAG: hypothetical protein Q4F83_02860 [Eubacteriales bacterium]|nr:hypothetical protein [Eubacteriales bacterium]
MELDAGLLKQFAEIANGSNKEKSTEVTAYGTVVKNGDNTYVRLDGTDSLTPVSMAMDAEHGDRVIVTVKNHTATITGNISSPASARTATKFMKLTDDGLVIGELDEDGNPVGSHTLTGSNSYNIVDENGTVVGTFSGTMINLGNGMAVMTVNEINLGKGKAIFATDHAELASGAAYLSPKLLKLGNSDETEIQMCNGKGNIKMDGDVLMINGTKAIGLRNLFRQNAANRYYAEIVCRADSTNPTAAIQAYKAGGVASSVIADLNGVRVNVPSGKKMSVNGIEVLLSNSLMVVGTVSAKGSIESGKTASITAKVPVPSGYTLAGIREIKTNHNNACKMSQFYTNPSTNQVGASFVNTSGTDFTSNDMSKSNRKLKVDIEWFAFRCSAPTVTGENIVEWVDS